ncbi:unnamed protein product [Lactuca saligna]|uniref:Cytochrome P450 n=1 Tax=Lactuca saligna TaxID=75948 RepID=A0AA35YI08_LACSI|nr:unnamed protein product [Lactuca saligna]
MISDSRWSWWSELITSKKDDLTFQLLIFSVISLPILWYSFRKATFRLPPGPRGLPVLGYLPFLSPDLHHEFTKLGQRYGRIFKLQLGRKTYVIVSSSDLAKEVVRVQDDVFSNRDPPVAGIVVTYGGKDIVWSDNNSYWRNLRKVFVSEVLSNKNLEASRSFRRAGVRKIIKHVYETMGNEVDVGGMAFTSSLSVVTNMMWGKSLDEKKENSNLGVGFREVISKIVELLGAANVSDLFPVLSRFDLQGVERKIKQQLQKVDEIFQRIIDDRMSVKPEESVEQEGRKDLLQILLEHKQKDNTSTFSITQIKALFMDIVTGGTDTTSTMAEWTMAELLKHPEIMKKIQDELEEVVGLNNIVEESHLSKLHYLDAAIKETFRLHPPLPLLIGRCPNMCCNVGGYTVPKGSNVFINVWAIHRDPKYWENPTEFDPNRFLNPDGTTKYDYSGNNTNFLAFGSGRRRCPGVPLGEKMLVYLLASLLHSFDWTLPKDKEHELSDKFGIVLKKRNPLMAIPSQRLPDKILYM